MARCLAKHMVLHLSLTDVLNSNRQGEAIRHGRIIDLYSLRLFNEAVPSEEFI
jgi:hypothetical protein